MERTLAQCSSIQMMVFDCASWLVTPTGTRPETSPGRMTDALERWDDNGDERITCAEARQHELRQFRGVILRIR